MKRTKCCMSCRRRHRKCVTQPGATKCGACIESGYECHFESDIRFKHTRTEEKSTQRKWAKVPDIISFTTPRGIDGQLSNQTPEDTTTQPDVSVTEDEYMSQPILETSISPSVYDHDQMQSESSPFAPVLPDPTHSPDARQLTEREAFLFMIYVHKLAPLSDACDDARHFALQVPRLALQNPMILNGILALASRYDSYSSQNSLESTYYHNKCIALLIKAFAQPPSTWDTTLLTAVVIARLYEENDNEADPHYHLAGTQNLLNHEVITKFVMQGGLAEAASWVHLRQSIYVYIAGKKPMEICLENFARSTVFQRRDDSAYANQVVYLFAKILKLLFPMGEERGLEEWEDVEREVEMWFEERPVSFKPIFHRVENALEDRPFPVICFAATVPVIGMQHYYAAKAVLSLHKLNHAMDHIDPSIDLLKDTICASLCTLMGLALSNEHAGNAFYLPAHMLSLCGYCITDPCVQRHAIRYLDKVEQVIKWRTKWLIETLKMDWDGADRGTITFQMA